MSEACMHAYNGNPDSLPKCKFLVGNFATSYEGIYSSCSKLTTLYEYSFTVVFIMEDKIFAYIFFYIFLFQRPWND